MKSHFSEKSDEQLMLEFCQGNNNSFEVLYRMYYPKLVFYTRQMSNLADEEISDLMHDIFLKIIKNKNRFDQQKRFSSWIYTITHNECINAVNRTNRCQSDANAEMVSYDMEFNDSNKYEVRQSLRNLKPAQRQVVILRFNFGCSLKEISEILEISEGTAKSRLFYALQKLNEQNQLNYE